MYARPHTQLLPNKRYRVVRHVHMHRHTHTVTFRPAVPPIITDTFVPPARTAPLSAVSIPSTTGLPTPPPTPPLPPVGPRPAGFLPTCAWCGRHAMRTLRQTVWPAALTVLDFVLRRTTVGFLVRPFNGQ